MSRACHWTCAEFEIDDGSEEGGERAHARIVRGVRDTGGEVERAWRIAAPMPL